MLTVAEKQTLQERSSDAAAVTASRPAHLSVSGVTKSFRSTRVLQALDIEVAKGEIISLLGPSGCGKTTLLRLIAGLVATDGGRIRLAERDITRLPAHRRNVGVVFQNYALFPHLSVAENVAFGLKARGDNKADIAERVTSALAMVRMTEMAARPVTALSGGQQQRVAVARALVVEPELLLLDEPFSALDRKLRETMQVELKTLLREKAITAIFVTHDQEEALAVSHRIAVMNAGRIEQFADPITLYEHPETAFVMEFVGLSTWLKGQVRSSEGGLTAIETAHGVIHAPATYRPGSRVVVAVRPEQIVAGRPDGEVNSISVRLQDVMCIGSKTHLYGEAQEGERVLAELMGSRVPAGIGVGQPAVLSWDRAATRVYPEPVA
jgi:putative spermidine/putrescine transport system ATP-binding protein